MPSKGIDAYAWLGVPDAYIEYSVPGRTVRHETTGRFWKEHLEVSKDKLEGPFTFSGRFEFKVVHRGKELMKQFCEINCLTGHLGESTMEGLKNSPSLVLDDLIISYGFYDAGAGEAGLPSSDQCYVAVSPNHSRWMEKLIPPGSPLADRKFNSLVLPAVHDCGMNDMTNAIALLQDAGDQAIEKAMHHLGFDMDVHLGLANKAIALIAPNIIESLSITQKDTISAMLAIGARYFEFRPAKLHSDFRGGNHKLEDVLYYQHACIPGEAHEKFLSEVVDFLKMHPAEIAVVQIRYDGVLPGCECASREVLDALFERVLQNSGIRRGRAPDLQQKTVGQLRDEGLRLIIMHPVPSFSTYTDEGNATLTGDTIIQELEKMRPERQNEGGNVFTNIQCQATSTNIRDAVIYSALAADASNSCLMATKAICDSKVLPWIRHHALEKLTADGLIVIMNDFIDGGTADVAIELCRKRLGL